MTPNLVNVELHDSSATIHLNRPDNLDKLSRDMINDLGAAFSKLESDPRIRAVILSCVHPLEFSAESSLATTTAVSEKAAIQTSRDEQSLIDQVASSGVPVIAVLNGAVAGKVFELALACHMRVSSTDTEFILPEVKSQSISVSSITHRLGRIIGNGHELHMPLDGQTVSAEDAFRIGLVNRVTDPDTLLSVAEEIAREISKLAPLAIRACLEAVNRGLELPLNQGFAIEAELFSRLFATEDVREGTSAFLEKREPLFKGR